MPTPVELEHLFEVVCSVHKAHADDLCWLDIDAIFAAAGLPVPDRRVGDKEAMKVNCARFIDTMCSGGHWKSYAELEEENELLRREVQPPRWVNASVFDDRED